MATDGQRWPFRTSRLLGSLAVVVALGAEAGVSPAGAQALALEGCTLPPTDLAARCGTLDVPEDPNDPSGRIIQLAVVVLPATGEEVAPDPVFPLHGGPGAAARFLIPMFAADPLRESRDFVFVDQRGTGESNGMHCRPESLPELLDVVLGFGMGSGTCPADDTDPAHYTTSVAVNDLDAVRAALGYDRVNLWGGSYGSRAALEFMRRHPKRVRTAVLDGVAPATMYIPLYFPPGAESALNLALEDCRDDGACAARFPDTRAALDRVLATLDARPATVEITDPRTGSSARVRFTRAFAASSVLFALYNAQTAAQLPLWIHEANQGRLEPLAGFGAGFAAALASQFSFGMTMAVACPEDAARYTRDQALARAEGSFLGPELALNFLDACEGWKDAPVPPEYWTPVHSDAPTLLMSGQADPVTPPMWAEQVMETLGDARHVVFPDLGHGATTSPCGRRLFGAFVRAGSAQDLDVSCASENRRPAFGGVER